MQFTYHKDAHLNRIEIESDLHKYLFKVRRHDINDDLYFRNLKDKNLYKYKVENINRRNTTLLLQGFEEKLIEPEKELHVGWCKIDPKSVEKVIASLNELGVTQITFINCEFSQRKYTMNYDKLEKLLINSSQQSGRSSIIRLNECESLDTFLKDYPDSFMFNFSKNSLDTKKEEVETIILGCEGGFSESEVASLSQDKIVGINSNLILRSETAILTIASKIIV